MYNEEIKFAAAVPPVTCRYLTFITITVSFRHNFVDIVSKNVLKGNSYCGNTITDIG
jgi:hypothetical protein